MRDIRIYDFEFNLLCIMTDVISSQWHILYNGVGTYEGHFRLADEISDIILKNQYVVITQGDLQAICTGKIADNKLTVCGRTVNWILSKRVRPPFKTSEIFDGYTDYETILLYCLNKGFIEPPVISEEGIETNEINEKRRVLNFILPKALGAPTMDSHFWRIAANDIEKLSAELCQKLDRGHRVVFDIINKCWRFEFIIPTENNVLISKESKTAYEFEFSEDLQNQADGGWYPEYNEEGERQTFWKYIRNQEKSGIYDWDCVLSESNKDEAQEELFKKSLKGDIKARLRNLKFGVDYQLGDVVPIYYRNGDINQTQYYLINGVNINMTPTNSYEEPIFKRYEK